MTEPEWIVGPGAIWYHRLKRTDGAFPIRRGTAQRLGLRLPPPDVVIDITPNIEAFNAGFKRLNEALQSTGFAFRFGDFQRRKP